MLVAALEARPGVRLGKQHPKKGKHDGEGPEPREDAAPITSCSGLRVSRCVKLL